MKFPKTWASIALALSLVPAAPGLAQSYPNRPIRLVLPAAPGGLPDVVVGVIQPALEQKFGQRIVVEPRPGAGGVIGTQAIARSPPDGYNLLLAATNFLAINQFIYPKLGYDPLTDFIPISQIVDVPMLMYVSNAIPVKTLKELIEYARTRPGKLNYGSAGVGTTPQMTMEIFAEAVGLSLIHVPYKSASQGAQALVANQVQLMMTGLATAAGQVKAGLVRPIAVVSPERLAALPDTATFKEAGYPELQAAIPSTWWGLAAPARTDPSIIRRWSTEIQAALREPVARQRYQSIGLTPIGSTPAEFAALIASDSLLWGKTVRALNIQPE